VHHHHLGTFEVALFIGRFWFDAPTFNLFGEAARGTLSTLFAPVTGFAVIAYQLTGRTDKRAVAVSELISPLLTTWKVPQIGHRRC